MTTIDREIKLVEPVLSDNSRTVLEKRYLRRDKQGVVIETPTELYKRVAETIGRRDGLQQEFYDLLAGLYFQPNSPTLMNAGTNAGTLSACFVLPVDDKMLITKNEIRTEVERVLGLGWDIDVALQHMAMYGSYNSSMMGVSASVSAVQKFGGGTGGNFSAIRPKGELISTTHGFACGPVSFMQHWNDSSRLVTQGGKRDGANMAILNYDHPDIMEFITAKNGTGLLDQFNISVNADARFFEAIKNNEHIYPDRRWGYFTLDEDQLSEARKYDNISVLSTFNIGSLTKGDQWYNRVPSLPAKYMMDVIAASCWETGDPGFVFMDVVEQTNPRKGVAVIESTNPCGEVPQEPWEACILGSMNLPQFVSEFKSWLEEMEFDERINERLDFNDYVAQFDTYIPTFDKSIRLATRFLDAVVDESEYHIPQIREVVMGNRKIGLGSMGFQDLLIDLGFPYASHHALNLSELLSYTIERISTDESRKMAEESGPYPNWFATDVNPYPVRNATRTCIAPTGTIAIIAGASSGIEPLFSVAHYRRMGDGTLLPEVNERLRLALKAGGFEHLIDRVKPYSDNLKYKFSEDEEMPQFLRELFREANDIDWHWHIRHQARWQKNVGLAVSKTINMGYKSTPKDIAAAFMFARESGVKGITIYRDGSRSVQVLDKGTSSKPDPVERNGGYVRRKLNNDAPSVTHTFHVGEFGGYFTVALFEDDTPGAIFITASKNGSGLQGFLNEWAIATSHALQTGVPLEIITKRHIGQKYEPNGMTQNPDIPTATSVIDYICKWLVMHFSTHNAVQVIDVAAHETGSPSGDFCPDCGMGLDMLEGCMLCRSCGYTKCG